MNTSSPRLAGKKILCILPVLLLLAAGCGSQASTATPQSGMQGQNTSADQGPVKTFTVTGKNYSFTPNEIKVNKGDRVKITFTNEIGFHDFVLDAFNVKTSRISGGQSADVEFTADKTGTFEFYCSVANHRDMGMKGNIIVQ